MGRACSPLPPIFPRWGSGVRPPVCPSFRGSRRRRVPSHAHPSTVPGAAERVENHDAVPASHSGGGIATVCAPECASAAGSLARDDNRRHRHVSTLRTRPGVPRHPHDHGGRRTEGQPSCATVRGRRPSAPCAIGAWDSGGDGRSGLFAPDEDSSSAPSVECPAQVGEHLADDDDPGNSWLIGEGGEIFQVRASERACVRRLR